MKRPAFLSGFLMMLVGLGLTIAVMFVRRFTRTPPRRASTSCA